MEHYTERQRSSSRFGLRLVTSIKLLTAVGVTVHTAAVLSDRNSNTCALFLWICQRFSFLYYYCRISYFPLNAFGLSERPLSHESVAETPHARHGIHAARHSTRSGSQLAQSASCSPLPACPSFTPHCTHTIYSGTTCHRRGSPDLPVPTHLSLDGCSHSHTTHRDHGHCMHR